MGPIIDLNRAVAKRLIFAINGKINLLTNLFAEVSRFLENEDLQFQPNSATLYFNSKSYLFPRLKRMEREAGRSPPSSAEVKNIWRPLVTADVPKWLIF
jgi:hypothetical protein